MLTAEEVDDLYTCANGVRNDLVSLVSTTTNGTAALLLENALTNTYRILELSTKLLASFSTPAEDWT